MYGTKEDGAIWDTCYTDCIVNMGFVQGVALPCCFEHMAWKASVVVHGEDFTALENADGLSKCKEGTAKTFECKMKGRLGRGKDDLKEMRMLNLIVRINGDGLRDKADL